MENFFLRYRNETVLVAILFAQIIALATQIRVPSADSRSGGPSRLIRVWAVNLVAPFQKGFVYGGSGLRGVWSNYLDLRNVRQQNLRLQQQIDRMRLEQAGLQQDVAQARRLQDLLEFKQQYVAKTIAAQVIGTSGTDLSRVIYIDRGTNDGIAQGMAVITPDGIVGKISRADKRTSQVLLITDLLSGAGVLLERQRLNGVLKGAAAGYPEIQNVMSDEEIKAGDAVITTGGDRVFPKGLKVGTVASVAPDYERDPFLAIKIKPAADLNRLEEVLVITELAERAPLTAEESRPASAAEMLGQRLPSAKKKTEEVKPGSAVTPTGGTPGASGVAPKKTVPAVSKPQSVPQSPPANPGTPQERSEPR
ncbi:MAG TPA: rod shape-determining protein MreC [Terriglobales bacterium]|nr:rod shape-determining protein MreC [Terriglobales bacterium]